MIKKYRRKEYIISAVRWLGEENCEEVFAFLGLEHPDDDGFDLTHIHFDNPDGGVDTAEIGDWIVADGKRAGHSVCKDIWFRATFEEEEPEAQMMVQSQPVQAECTNCKGSGLDPRHNGEFVCPDCAPGVPPDDTLPQWLYQRFACPGQPAGRIAWDLLDESVRSYWKHTAAAVRRAVARDGSKEPS